MRPVSAQFLSPRHGIPTQIYLQSLDVATINEANKKIIQQVINARF